MTDRREAAELAAREAASEATDVESLPPSAEHLERLDRQQDIELKRKYGYLFPNRDS